MLIYWALFGFFAVGALLTTFTAGRAPSWRPMLAVGAVLTALLIGLRYNVGADWPNYEFMFSYARQATFERVLELGDPGYQLLNWLVKRSDWQIWVVNLVCGALFSWGLFRFCKAQADPWLAALVAVPYMVIVVAMGYTRQAVALGILMAGLASVIRGGSTTRFALFTVGAALFHKTAVVAFPLVALSSRRNRFLNLLIAVAASVLLYDLFLGDAMDQFVQHYIKTGYSSQGAFIRVVMNIVAALVFWIAGHRLQFSEIERTLWRNFSLAAAGFLVLLFVLPSSTAVDRMSLYVMPLQIAVLARVPLMFRAQLAGKAAVMAYLALVQFVWLNFAQHASYWVPYRFFPLWG
jgi:hypothetical protein